MRSIPHAAFPGPAPAHWQPQRNPHVGWWIAGGLVVAAVIGVGALYWYTRHRVLIVRDNEGFEHVYRPVSCDRFGGHSFCIYLGDDSGLYTYAVDGSQTPSTERHSTALEAAAAAKLFLAILTGDVQYAKDQQQQAA